MKIFLNGEEQELSEGLTVAQLLAEVGAPVTGIAVACNDEVVRRSAHAEAVLHHGDRIEIIKAVAGG